MHKVIDILCEIEELSKDNSQVTTMVDENFTKSQSQAYSNTSTQGEFVGNNCQNPQLSTVSAMKYSILPDKRVMSNVLFSDKKTGYIALESDDIPFIRPDRKDIDVDNIDICLRIGHIIRDTKQPNCKCARLPIKSCLNIKAWEYHLSDYPDKRILQYLRFRFPLSLTKNVQLSSQHVTNHYLA